MGDSYGEDASHGSSVVLKAGWVKEIGMVSWLCAGGYPKGKVLVWLEKQRCAGVV